MEISLIILVFLLVGIFIIGYWIGALKTRESLQEEIKDARKDAVLKSRNSLSGKLWEQVAPHLPGFKYNPNDIRFVGAPVDYIVFDGMSEKDIRKIVFLEVKSGKSQLNEQEKKLKDAVINNRVEWDEFRVN